MSLPTVSVVVVSWHRPDHLRRCLMSLRQQDHPALELCLVLDPDAATRTLADLQQGGWTARLAQNPGGNISQARNIGLGQARGDLVAFIDDDAVAEPTWASRLAAAFADPHIVAATGFTRGRNGISTQWAAAEVDHLGADHPLAPPDAGLTLQGSARRAVKPVGTNCAFRRAALLAVGGFDPAYHFYLEDADIGLRLAAFGKTAVVPGAQVVHAFAASDRRRADRVPTDLHQIGASAQVFLRRHAPPDQWPAALAALRREQSARLDRHRRACRLGRAEVARLMATLEAGIAEGSRRDLPALPPIAPPAPGAGPAFAPLPGTGPRPGLLIAGRIWSRRRLLARARAARAAGRVVTLLILSPTARPHRLALTDDGIWLQEGGLFGRSDRNGPMFRFTTFAARLREEAEIAARTRFVA